MEDRLNKTPNILLVEDNNINRRIMSRLLHNMDIIVVEAKNGEEAIEYAINENFSIILMDLLMPKLSGYETTKRIHELSELNKTTPVIAVSSDNYDVVTDKMIEYGINDVISKPLRKEVVEKIFSKYISKDVGTHIFNAKEFESFYKDKLLEEEIVTIFLSEKENDMNRLDKAFKSNDIEEIYESLHYMKGSFTYLKANKILQLTQKMLDLGKLEKLNEVILLKDTLYNNLDILYKELQVYKNKG